MSNTEFDPMADDAAMQLRAMRDSLNQQVIAERDKWYVTAKNLALQVDRARFAFKQIAYGDPMNEVQMRELAYNALQMLEDKGK